MLCVAVADKLKCNIFFMFALYENCRVHPCWHILAIRFSTKVLLTRTPSFTQYTFKQNVETNYKKNCITDFLEFRFINEVEGNESDKNVRLWSPNIYKVKRFKCWKSNLQENGITVDNITSRIQNGEKKQECFVIKKNY